VTDSDRLSVVNVRSDVDVRRRWRLFCLDCGRRDVAGSKDELQRVGYDHLVDQPTHTIETLSCEEVEYRDVYRVRRRKNDHEDDVAVGRIVPPRPAGTV
jgi:hypothetical protein